MAESASDLAIDCLRVVEKWYKDRFDQKGTASDQFIACAGIKVAEISRAKWPIERSDIVAKGGRFRSTGPFIQKVLRRFGEEREYASEGGRTTGGSIEAAEDLASRLGAVNGFPKAEKIALADEIQKWIYEHVVRPALDHEGLKIELNIEKIPPDIITGILAAGAKQGVSGAVAQHLVGAKLALRFPKAQIDNYSYTTQDKQLGRKGDFEVGDTIIHVTMSPSEAVVDKCAANLKAGYRVILLVPRIALSGARYFVEKSQAPSQIWLTSIKAFVGQNLVELAEFGIAGLRVQLRGLLEKYNERAQLVEAKRSLLIKIPEKL